MYYVYLFFKEVLFYVVFNKLISGCVVNKYVVVSFRFSSVYNIYFIVIVNFYGV